MDCAMKIVFLACCIQLIAASPTPLTTDSPSRESSDNAGWVYTLALSTAFIALLALCAKKGSNDTTTGAGEYKMENNPVFQPQTPSHPNTVTPPTSAPTSPPVAPQRPPSTLTPPAATPTPKPMAPQPTAAPPPRPAASHPDMALPRPPHSTAPAPAASFVDPLFAGSTVTQAPDAPALPTRARTSAPAIADPMLAAVTDYENAPAIPARRSAATLQPPPRTAAPPVQPRASAPTVDTAYLTPVSQGATASGPPPPQPAARRAPKGYALVSLAGEGSGVTGEVVSPDQMALTSASVQVADMQGQLSKRQVPRNRINLVKQLGSGNFGEVYKATYTEISGQVLEVAVKSLKDADDEKQTRLFLLEAQIMMEFDHVNVLKLLGVTTTDTPWCMVTELCEFGDLKDLLTTLHDREFILNCEEKLRLLGNVAAGMHYLSTLQFIHRDLAARNCLVTSDGSVKIGDFGMSRLVLADEDYYRSHITDMLPLRWMAVESMENLKFTLKTDVWSFGVVGFEIFSYGAKPYGKLSNLILHSEVSKGMRPEQPEGCPDPVYELFKLCWHNFPEGRPTFREVYEMVADLHAQEIKRAHHRMIRDLGVMFRMALDNPNGPASDPYKTLPPTPGEEEEEGDDPYKKLEGEHKTYIDTKFLPPLPSLSTNTLEKDSMPFFHGSISRTAAERLLMSQGRILDLEGCFLVRTSSSNPNDYTLSAIFEAKVWHYRIQKLDSGRYRFYGSEYDSLPELINYHSQFKGSVLLGVLTRHCEA
eukprot:m.117085 g.117085  ORF g.117085 m.117085 type:complete len:762 (+) comp15532_c0_seq2:135-2420(+)